MRSIYLFLVAVLVLFLHAPQARALGNKSIGEEIERIYSRYSNYLDSKWTGRGWDYAVPSRHYREAGRNSWNNLRMQATFVAFYMFRYDDEATQKIHKALANALIELSSKQAYAVTRKGQEISTRSFNDAIGIYLALRILDARGDIFSHSEIQDILKNMKEMYPWVLKAKDTENRAILGAAYGLKILNHPLLNFSEEEREDYLNLIKEKIDTALDSVDSDYVYREGRGRAFSAHYHLVFADMLYYIGSALGNSEYADISKKMLNVVHKKYPLRHLSFLGSGRPTGVGLQTVLLKTVGEKFLGNKKWKKFWEIEKAGRGFIDPKAKNRLVWRDQVDKTLNDDYSFANMAEIFWEYLD